VRPYWPGASNKGEPTMQSTKEITNNEDVIDSRSVIERIKYLDRLGEENLDEEEQAEFRALTALQEDAKEYAEDWQDGVTLIRDSYFTDYAEELCKDIGDLPKDIPWYIEIDWEKTAGHIQQDYTEVDFNGVSYWVR